MKELQQELFYQYINHKMTPQFKIILEDKYHYDIEAIKKMISSYVKKYATFKSGCLRYLKGYPLEYPTQSIMVKKIN